MKKWVKILWSVLGVVFLIVLILASYLWVFVISPGIALKDSLSKIDQVQMQQDMQDILKGDCTKLPALETQIGDIAKQVEKACKNAILKKQIEQQQPGICDMVKDKSGGIYLALEQLKTVCE